MRKRLRLCLATLVSAGSLLACGGDGGEAAPPAPPSLTPTSGRLSADGVVAPGCTGGSASAGTVYAN